ncbi:MAG TPA: hypothetical protein ENI77_05630 [Nitrospirae bacterium]|nr:hypothetical protein [Nitrospirota bacterium]
MSLINLKQIKDQIALHEAKVKRLKELLVIGAQLEGKELSKAIGEAKIARRGRKPKRKRGAITNAIKAMLESSSKPVSSGEIRKALEDKKLTDKGSSTVYSMLQQLAKRGTIAKTVKGYSISTARSSAPASKKAKLRQKKM